MAQISTETEPHGLQIFPLPLADKSSKNHDSRTTKTSMSKIPQLQTSLVFQKIVLGTLNLPLLKRVRIMREQVSAFQQIKQQLLLRIEIVRDNLLYKSKIMVEKCKILRSRLREIGYQK